MGKVIYLDLYRKEKESDDTQIEFDFPLKGKPMNNEDIYSTLDNNVYHDERLEILDLILKLFKK